MSELGWAGIIDEEHGGQGLGIVELVILMEELGYALAPVPFVERRRRPALQFAGTDEQERAGCRHRVRRARGTVGMLATARRGSSLMRTRPR